MFSYARLCRGVFFLISCFFPVMKYIETAIGFLFSTLEFALRKLSLEEHFDILISGGCIVVVIKIKTAIMK